MLEALEARAMLAFDPTPIEQHLLELTNRFRLDPQRELSLLTTGLGTPARSSDADVDSALRFFNVNGSVLQQQWASLTPSAPLAWNEALYDAAEVHSQAMIAADVQEHQIPGGPDLSERITDAGYTGWATAGESIYAYARSAIHTHAGFLLDWGNGPNGIQDPPGHRLSAINPQFRETGIRVLNPGLRAGKSTGPLVVTQDFGRRFTQSQAFLLGVVYADGDNDGFYSQGEGLGGVRIQVTASGTGTAVAESTSMTAGGWQISLPTGTYNVTFSGAGFGNAVTYRDVVVRSDNVKLDAVRGVRPPAPGFRLNGSNNQTIAAGDSTPAVQDGTDFGGANVVGQTVERTFAVTNTGTQTLRIQAGGPGGVSGRRVLISGVGAADFTVVQDLPTEIAAGQLATFTVRFDPSAVGVRTASVTLATSASGAESVTFSISGRGAVRPVVQVRGGGLAIQHGDRTPRVVDGTGFGTVVAPDGVRERTFEIVSAGSANLNVRSVTLENAAPGFRVVEAGLGRLGAGLTRAIRVSYTGSALDGVGVKTAELVIVTNDPATPVYRIMVRANVVAGARLAVRSAGAVVAPSATADFGTIATDGGVRVREFVIRSTGLAPLRLTGTPRVVIEGLGADQFSVTMQPVRDVVVPGQGIKFRVRFDPSTAGPAVATVRIVSNDALVNMFEFTAVGVGQAGA